MLKRVRIQNYKCLRDVDVELSPFTVLIGPNDSGKTSFLTSLKLLGDLANPLDKQNAQRVGGHLRQNAWRQAASSVISLYVESETPISFSFRFEVESGNNRQLQELMVGADESIQSEFPHAPPNKQRPQITFRGHQFHPDPNQSLLTQLSQANGGRVIDDLILVQQELKITEPYHFSPSEMRKAAEAKMSPILSARGENLAAVLNSMLTGADRTAVNELEQALHSAIPTLRAISTPTEKENNGARRVIRFGLSGPERPPLTISASEVSDGAMFLTAFLALIHTQSTQVLLIEEPENGLHPSRLQSVIELLKKVTTGELGYAPRQVVLSTHSPLLLNFVDPSEVRIFRRGTDDATTIVRMDQMPDIDRLTKEFAPGELWYLFGEEGLSREVAR